LDPKEEESTNVLSRLEVAEYKSSAINNPNIKNQIIKTKSWQPKTKIPKILMVRLSPLQSLSVKEE